jgi:signal transduction histidine kinase
MKSETVDHSMLSEWNGAELQDAEPCRTAEIEDAPAQVSAGDERQLKQMLTQLLDNAWKFSRDRDRVRIEVRGERDGDRLHVSIRDHGAGFDMRYADKLFEPFQRLHRVDEGAGNGIGLAIVQRIVERHGGRIRAESAPGQGSTFHLDLPAATIADPESNPDESPA